MKLINTRVITTALTVVTALVVAACAGGELKEPTPQALPALGLREAPDEGLLRTADR